MRCVNCNNDMKVKKDAFFKGRCSNCGHEFAITHPENGISDARVQGAITRISDNGKLYYLPSHTEYEIRRGQRRKSARRKWYVLAALILLCVVAWLIFWMDWVVFGFIVGAIAFVAPAKGLFQSHEPQADLRSLIERFEDINPPSHWSLPRRSRSYRMTSAFPLIRCLSARTTAMSIFSSPTISISKTPAR